MLNRCEFIGNVGQEPKIFNTDSGKRIARLNIGVTESWKDKLTGEKKDHTDWINIVVMSDGLAGVCQQYIKKGSKIYVSGRMQTREYEKDGEKRYVTEVVLSGFDAKLVMLDSKNNIPTNDDLDSDIPF